MKNSKRSFSEKQKQTRANKQPAALLGCTIDADSVNPPQTGTWRFLTPHIGAACIGCGLCAAHCPEIAIQMTQQPKGRRAQIDYAYCKGCGLCATRCPQKAISMK